MFIFLNPFVPGCIEFLRFIQQYDLYSSLSPCSSEFIWYLHAFSERYRWFDRKNLFQMWQMAYLFVWCWLQRLRQICLCCSSTCYKKSIPTYFTYYFAPRKWSTHSLRLSSTFTAHIIGFLFYLQCSVNSHIMSTTKLSVSTSVFTKIHFTISPISLWLVWFL
jgi:hypothetical protein